MIIDCETNEPINVCCVCKKEVVGWVDDIEKDFICNECNLLNGE